MNAGELIAYSRRSWEFGAGETEKTMRELADALEAVREHVRYIELFRKGGAVVGIGKHDWIQLETLLGL